MSTIYWRDTDRTLVEAGEENPLPVQVLAPGIPPRAPDAYRVTFNIAAVAGDAVVLRGAASKLVKVREVVVTKPTATQTITMVRRTTADSGGTSTVAIGVPLDARAPAAQAELRLYTAAPTQGTSAGELVRATVTSTDTLTIDCRNDMPALYGNTDSLAILVDATSTLVGWIVWTEEAA